MKRSDPETQRDSLKTILLIDITFLIWHAGILSELQLKVKPLSVATPLSMRLNPGSHITQGERSPDKSICEVLIAQAMRCFAETTSSHSAWFRDE